MSDLISRSKVISVLEQLEEHSLTGKMDISNAIYLLNNQPTAYSVDKIVAELEENASRYTKKYITPYGNNEYRDTKAISVNKAIEIVKQSGVSEDVCEWRLCDEEANVYDTSCRNPHILIEGTPKENNYEYCPYCGKKIKAVE